MSETLETFADFYHGILEAYYSYCDEVDGGLRIPDEETAIELSGLAHALQNRAFLVIARGIQSGAGEGGWNARRLDADRPLFIACKLISRALNQPVREGDPGGMRDAGEERYRSGDTVGSDALHLLVKAHRILGLYIADEANDLVLDGVRDVVTYQGRSHGLTQKQAGLLEILIDAGGAFVPVKSLWPRNEGERPKHTIGRLPPEIGSLIEQGGGNLGFRLTVPCRKINPSRA